MLNPKSSFELSIAENSIRSALSDSGGDGMVNVAHTGSLKPRAFNKLVIIYNQDTSDVNASSLILGQLKSWSEIHKQLEPFIEGSDKLKDIKNISVELSHLSRMLVSKFTNKEVPLSGDELLDKLNFLEEGERGFIAAITHKLLNLLLN